MRSRRGEVQFVANRVGRSNDPREVLGLAREMKTSRAEALGWVTLWEEFVLEVGDAVTGRVKGYDSSHVAAKLGFEGAPRKIIDALKHAGVLGVQRGVFFHPYWRQSITGTYASDRAELREFWRVKKEEQRRETTEGRPHDVPGTTGDNRGTSLGTAGIDIGSNGHAQPERPPTPLGRGEPEGLRRWDWLRAHHERPTNTERCIKYLGAMSAEDWELCQWIFGPRASGPALTSLGKKRAIRADTHKFLTLQLYEQFRRERVDKLRHESRPHRAPAAEKQAEAALQVERTAAARRFVLEMLSDPSVTEAKKKALRERWARENPDEPAPWEAATDAVPVPLQ